MIIKNTYTSIILVIIAILMLALYFLPKRIKIEIKDRNYDKMLIAAKKMDNITKKIYNRKTELGIKIDLLNDSNKTGLIGDDWSRITTTLGSLDSKRTSTNPDFAALMVKIFLDMGLKKGDKVAVNMSSSFPSLNFAVICALDTLEIDGIIINSVGSSTYGGNIEDFTYLDMENYIYQKNMIKNKTIGYSLGGTWDVGGEFEDEVKDNIKKKNENYGVRFFYERDLNKNLIQRFDFYNNAANDTLKAFINIGGNLLSLGGNEVLEDNSSVLLKKNNKLNGGLVGMFKTKNIPILFLLNIKSIANRYGIPIDPIPLPPIGTSPVYFKQNTIKLDYVIIGIFIILIALLKMSKGYK